MNLGKWMLAVAMAMFAAVGCEPDNRNMQEFNEDDPRYNREGAPPTGLKQNPARPQSDHPDAVP